MNSKYLPLLPVLATSLFQNIQAQNSRPNILLITADDLNYSSVGCFGSNVSDITPNIDALAREGIRFDYGYVNIAVSQPSRGVMLTGMYSNCNGVKGFYESPYDIPTIMEVMGDNGYITGIAGKVTHCSPRGQAQWDFSIDQNDLKYGRDPQTYARVMRDFVRQAVDEEKPFFFMANSHDSHRPFHGSAASNRNQKKYGFPDPSRLYTEDEVEIPGFLPDLPNVRLEITQYFNSVKRLDNMVGAVLAVLEEEGLAENTMVIFLSDNGISEPFAKTNCYLNSTKTPLIVRYPGITKPNSVDKRHMVSCVDLMPTILEACNIEIPQTVEGRSFLSILQGKRQKDRDLVFCQFYETSAHRAYPMFTVQSKDFGYIFNPWSDGNYVFKAESMSGLAFGAMQQAAKTDAQIKERVDFLYYRAQEEFYDLQKDPYAYNNLINDPSYQKKIEHFREDMLSWLEIHDPAAAQVMKHRNDPTAVETYMNSQKKQ